MAALTNPLKIAYVSPSWPARLRPNGVGHAVEGIVHALRGRGHKVWVLSSNVDPATSDSFTIDLRHGFKTRTVLRKVVDTLVYRTMRNRWDSTRKWKVLVDAFDRLIAEHGIQIIEMEEAFGAAAWVIRRKRVPVIVRLHGPWFLNGPALGIAKDRKYYGRVRAEQTAITAAAAVTSPSRDVLERTKAFYGVKLSHSAVIPNPMSLADPVDRWSGTECDPNHILFVGRFDRLKGGDVVLRAFDCVISEFPEARLTFVGPDRGFIDEVGTRWSIDDYMSYFLPSRTRARIDWLGSRSPECIKGLRKRAMVTIIGSRIENFPTTILEAFAVGCPVVATRVGGIPEIVNDKINGLLCESEDPVDMSSKICSLLHDRNRAARLGKEALKSCEAFYSPRRIADVSAAFYRSVLAERNGAIGVEPTAKDSVSSSMVHPK